jgi:hypothetical protein
MAIDTDKQMWNNYKNTPYLYTIIGGGVVFFASGLIVTAINPPFFIFLIILTNLFK